ncbi:MAG: nucleotidyl transferase AbiEii/AbiGii toxin family protein [Thermoleophilaceae bacterium]
MLHGWLREYAREHGLPEGRVKHAIDRAIVISALERARHAGSPAFAIKGGVAMELRLRLDARATRDLDAVFLGAFDGWLETLDDALAAPIAGFSLTRGEPEPIGTTGAARVAVRLAYRGRRWGTVTLEVAQAEAGHVLDVDEVDGFDLSLFGLPRPERVPVVGLPYLVAQKLHACTEPLPGRENPRVRDLIDLQLVQPLLADGGLHVIRDACIAVFDERATHPWPPRLTTPTRWPEAYARLTDELASPHVAATLDAAARSIEALVARIDDA